MSGRAEILVTWITRVSVALQNKLAAAEDSLLRKVLQQNGFEFSQDKKYLYADSTELDANETKALLRKHGIGDTEYQIYFEYTRKWGML